MPEYNYVAVDQEGTVHKGKISANNPLDLEQNLRSNNLELISEKELKIKSIRSKKISRPDHINFLINLYQLINAGVPIIDGLKDIRDSMPKSYFKDLLTNCIESIEGGKTLSESFAQFPDTFDTVFVSLIHVGEETGQLGKVVEKIAESLKWVDEMASQTKKVMIYPLIISLVVFSVVFFLMTYLVPKLIPIITNLGGEIPGHTSALINLSNFFSEYWYMVLSFPALLITSLKALKKRSTAAAYQLDRFAISCPLIGPINYKLKVARFCNYFALLYSAGVTIIDCLSLCENIMDNTVLNRSVKEAREHIRDGKTISAGFQKTTLFSPLVIRMIKIGENTGELDRTLDNVCYFYTRDAKESIDKIEPALGPMLTVFMGAILGWIMVSVMGPVYEIFNRI